jgi:hypothetical protein
MGRSQPQCIAPMAGNAKPEGDSSVSQPAIPLTNLDDSTLISQRWEIRAAMQKLPPNSHAAQSLVKQYDALNDEFGRRVAWAVDMLLADPEALGNDALETDLYLLREKLRQQALG